MLSQLIFATALSDRKYNYIHFTDELTRKGLFIYHVVMTDAKQMLKIMINSEWSITGSAGDCGKLEKVIQLWFY